MDAISITALAGMGVMGIVQFIRWLNNGGRFNLSFGRRNSNASTSPRPLSPPRARQSDLEKVQEKILELEQKIDNMVGKVDKLAKSIDDLAKYTVHQDKFIINRINALEEKDLEDRVHRFDNSVISNHEE